MNVVAPPYLHPTTPPTACRARPPGTTLAYQPGFSLVIGKALAEGTLNPESENEQWARQ
jgi:hypothetical protein